MAISSTITAKEQEQQEKKVAIEFFHIAMIPDAMDKMKWTTAAKLMRHWFSIKPAFTFTVQSRRIALNTDAVKLPVSQVNFDIVKMSWTIQYEQVRTGIDELRSLWKSAKGIERLKEQLNKSKLTDEDEVFIGYSESVRELDANAQVNILPIGSKFDTVNEWYGAMGNTTLKVCVRGKTNRVDGGNVFLVDKLGFYLKDTYDFVDEDTAPEPLGIWSKNRVLDKKSSSLYMSTYLSGMWGRLVRDYSGFVPVFNSDFRLWQKKHGAGGDFIVLSDVLWMDSLPHDKKIIL